MRLAWGHSLIFSLISISIFRYSHQTNCVVVNKINTEFHNGVLFR